MNITIEPGKYVIAVSGGVDSMVLLDVLQDQKNVDIVVAHFDHGIRVDSNLDRELVQEVSRGYDLPFEYIEGDLGPDASEETARKARYNFLNRISEKYQARAIVTAHHQDDVIETAFINLLRGTGRKGLTSLSSKPNIVRPLLGYPKKDLINYAKNHSLKWREDSTNQDTNYLRNYIRITIIPKLTETQRRDVLKYIDDLSYTNIAIDQIIASHLQLKTESYSLDKKLFIRLSYKEAAEFIAQLLRLNGIRNFDSKTIDRLVIGAKTLKSGSRIDINNNNYLHVDQDYLTISAS